MGIMTQMRNRMKFILGILILAFLATIVFSWGMGYSGDTQAENNVGSINGSDISLESFYQNFNGEIKRYREQSGQEITEQLRIRIRDQVWENIISEVLVQKEIEKYGLKATDEEVYFQLENNPPEFLKTQEAFMTEGRFDMGKYLDMLHNPQGNEWIQIENYYRSVIPGQKLQNLITASVMVGEKEVKDAFYEDNVNFKIDYLVIPFTAANDDELIISESDIAAYYKENKEEKYGFPEKRILQYVSYEKKAGKEDTMLVLQDIDEVMARLEEGEKFEDLAKLYSQDGSAERGGDLGWFGKGQMVPAFEDAAFLAPLNKVIGPVLTSFGYHLIIVKEKKTENGEEKLLANHILIKIETGPNTIDALSSDARIFSYDAEDLGFTRALETYKIDADTVKNGIAREDYFFSGIGFNPELTRFAFKSEAGKISEVIVTDKQFVVAQLLEVSRPGFQDIESVKKSIERELKKEKREELSGELANAVAQKASAGEELSALKAENGKYSYKQSDGFTLMNMPAELKNATSLVNALKSLEINEVTSAHKTNRAWVIAKLRLKGKLDEGKLALQKVEIMDRLLQEKKNLEISNYMKDLRDNAHVEDWRSEFF